MENKKNAGTPDHEIKRVSHDLLLLHRDRIAREQIGKAVALRKWRFRALAELPELWDALDGGAKAILIDTSFLPELYPQLPWLESPKRGRPALFFTSDRCDIQIHLQAIRAGASQLFSEPLDLNALVTALEEYITPTAKPCYKVLIVEDDESQAKLAADLLRKGPFETHVVTQPLDIMDAIWRLQPDLIFMMDFDIRGVDGIVLTKLIRERKESAAIPIIFLSGEDAPEKKMRVLQAGADDFLTLPIQLHQLLATVKNRIERAKAISSAGVCTAEPKSDSLPARRALLERLKQAALDGEAGGHAHGLIVVVLDDPRAGHSLGSDGDGDRLIGMLVEWLGPLLQKDDYLARIGYCRLALLVRRSNSQEVERLADLTYEVVNYRLAATAAAGRRLGIGLVSLDNAMESAEELLRQGESAATSASQHEVKGYLAHGWTPPKTEEYSVAEPETQEQRFRDALRKGSVTLVERRFVGRSERRHATKVIELIPRSGESEVTENLYQQAAQYGVASEFDCYVCDLGIQRLAEYSLRGEPVRLIIRQSAAVLEKETYVEFIKSELRKLHMVGTGLMLEFDLPSLATSLHQARQLFRELNDLGITISLSNFAWSKSAYKAIAYLKADAVRPRSSLLHTETDSIGLITSQIHALPTEIILPHVESHDQIAPPWSGSADYIQADFVR
ncbi:MAG: response regulator [Candidatus Thiodiazotropha sp.]